MLKSDVRRCGKLHVEKVCALLDYAVNFIDTYAAFVDRFSLIMLGTGL